MGMAVPCGRLTPRESKNLPKATQLVALQNPQHACLGHPSGLTSCFAPPGVARILTHEAGITDIVVLQVTFLL